MNNLLRTVALLLFSGLVFGAAESRAQPPAGDSLTIEVAVQRALEASAAVQQQLASVEAARARVDVSRSAEYPVIRGDADYARLSPVPEIAIPSFGVFDLVPADNWDLHLGAYHTLYDFGRRTTQVQLNESRVQSASHAVDLTRQERAYLTVRVFNSILFLRHSISVQDQEIAALNQHLDVTKKRVATGSATQFDVLTTQVRVATAENQRAGLRNTLAKQETVFRQLLNLLPDAPVRIKGEFSVEPIPMNRDSLVALALTQRPELQLARDAESSAMVQQRLARLEDMPSLKLNVEYGFKNGYPLDLNVLKSNVVAGAALSVPIWDGHRVRYRKLEADANLQAERSHLRDLQLQVTSETDQAIADMNTAEEKLAITAVQVEQADAAVRLARARYEAGTATNLDLLDAETNLAAAHLLQEQAKYAYAQSRYGLQQAIGAKM